MTVYLGDFAEDATLHFIWSSYNSSGASVTRSTNGTVSVYKDNGTTQSTAGVTDTEDFDTLTGIHACTIDLSADAFYAVGSNYTVVLSAATIDSQTVNAVLAHFSIENRTTFPKADYPSNFASMGIESDGHVHGDLKQWLGVAPLALSSQKVQSAPGSVTVGTNNDKTGYALTSTYDFAKGTTAMTEAYAANGAAPTPVQALYAIHQMLMQFAISGTSLTVRKLDNSTTAFTVTLNDDTDPTSAVRT
jgi:hypothetical protein